MIEYSDFQCPFCARYFVQTEPAINDNFIRDGQLRVIFRDYPIVELHPNAPAAHVASLCAAEQSAVIYWEMHDKLFQTQAEWGNATDPAANFERLAEESSADMDAFKACMADMASKQPLIDAALVEGQAIGVSGTPSFQLKAATGDPYLLVGAQPYEEFAAYVGALAKGEAPPVPAEQAQAEPQELPLWATPDGWKPDPDRPGFNVSGDQYMGNPEAKAVVLEFTDFQCPYCRQHALETQPTLNEKFVDTGDVLWIFRHYPLSFHPQAEAASVAAECAADQGQFWEMKKLLFDEQENWSVDEPKSKFMELAGQLSLDAAKFEVCIDDPATLENIQGDRDSVQLNGTPTFVIFVDGQLAGQPIGGALPTETFVDVMQQVVEQANK
jgi:protein-disulfide isomerase